MIERLFNICMEIKKIWGNIKFKRKILAYKAKAKWGKKNHERPNRIVEINWRQRKLNRVIDKYSTNTPSCDNVINTFIM